MNEVAICLLCVFAQVTLTFVAVLRMGVARIAAVKANEVKIAEIAIDSGAYPAQIKLLQNNARNQFETPILFYALIAIGLAGSALNTGVAIASVGYVGTRIAHHIIHTGNNRIELRMKVYLAGLLFLLVGWVSLGAAFIGLF